MRNSALNVAFYCCYYYFHNSCRYIQSVLCLVQLGAFVAEVLVNLSHSTFFCCFFRTLIGEEELGGSWSCSALAFYPQCGVEVVPVPRIYSAYHKIWSLLSLFWSCCRTGYGHHYFRDPSFHSPTAQRCELTLFL